MVSGDYKIMDGVYLLPHKTKGLDSIGKRELMFRKTPRGWVPDDFSHEQSLVLDTDKGLVILNSCSHGGAGNIINEVKETFPGKKVYGLIGGLHLFNKSEAEIREVAGKIRETGIEYVCTGHCTKDRAFHILKDELGDMIEQMKVGYQIVI
jgi:7,8-dihydropterin-6-yl-methyl-4-(beta-D-ribofuranosyl)aminobenzene 5'-phosphate synthase